MQSAQHRFIAVMGGWMGAAGVEHGVGEILQGSVIPEGIMILSWPDSAFFQSLSGEPAMTIVPDMLVTGILAVLISLLFAAWSVFFSTRRRGRQVMVLLAVLMLLFGDGIFPPQLGLLIAAAAGPRAGAPVPSGLRRALGRGWRWIFAACCLAWLALLPGVAVLDYFFGVDHEAVTLSIMAAAFSLLFLAWWGGIQHDRLMLGARQ